MPRFTLTCIKLLTQLIMLSCQNIAAALLSWFSAGLAQGSILKLPAVHDIISVLNMRIVVWNLLSYKKESHSVQL